MRKTCCLEYILLDRGENKLELSRNSGELILHIFPDSDTLFAWGQRYMVLANQQGGHKTNLCERQIFSNARVPSNVERIE